MTSDRTALAALSVVVAYGCNGLEAPETYSVLESAVNGAPFDAKPAPGDYDGDGCMDIGLKSGDGNWYIDLCATGGGDGFGGAWDSVFFQYGDSSVTPVPADYDGDLKTDIAIKAPDGTWAIDYAANGFGIFDVQYGGYGLADAIAAPADYDGDGKVDLAIKDSSGFWGIDKASNGFGSWDWGPGESASGYGGADWIPVPANYDGDVGVGGKPRADRAVKTNAGEWKIDNSSNGHGKTTCFRNACFWTAWDVQLTGYGGANAKPVPADYDNDGYADLAVKDDAFWRIDLHSGGYGSWNYNYPGYGGSWTIAVPGHYSIPNGFVGSLDLAVKDMIGGWWLIDKNSTGYGLWDIEVDNVNRPAVSDPGAPRITGTTIQGPNGTVAIVNGQYALSIGRKYTVAVSIADGVTDNYIAGVEINPALNIPASLRIGGGGTQKAVIDDHVRRFSVVCSVPGSFPVGFTLRDGVTQYTYNPDYGIRVTCKGPGGGVMVGRVTKRVCLPLGSQACGIPGTGNAHYSTGSETTGVTPIAGAHVTITGPGVPGTTIQVNSDQNGDWLAFVPTNVPLTTTITKSGFSDTIAVNVTVPDSVNGGLELNTALEEEFTSLTSKGMTYTTYLDYRLGRTVVHTVRVNPAFATIKNIQASPYSSSPLRFRSLVTTSQNMGDNWPVLINGDIFDEPRDTMPSGSYRPIGYFYSADSLGPAGGWVDSLTCPSCTGPLHPMLTMVGTGLNQQVKIVTDSWFNFFTLSPFESLDWTQVNGIPIWDRSPRDGVSDVNYALQCGNLPLLYNAINGEIFGGYDEETWLRQAATSIGVLGNIVYLTVVDGEGVWGANGVNGTQMGVFFRDVLHVDTAMALDWGISTDMVLWGSSGARRINTITGEDHAVDYDNYSEITQNADGVPNYIKVGVAP